MVTFKPGKEMEARVRDIGKLDPQPDWIHGNRKDDDGSSESAQP